MELEELLRDREYDEGQKRLDDAMVIAEEEWNKIWESLELVGDIGEFNKEDFMVGVIEEDVIIREPLKSPTKSVSFYSPTFYPMYFVQNLHAMVEKSEEKGYSTTEALYVYIELVTTAAMRLGLRGSFAMSYGVGYANVRTGWIAEKGYPLEREIFNKMFFSNRKKSYIWDSFHTSVRESFKEIFDKFQSWQKDEQLYKREVRSTAKVKPLMV